MSLAALEAHRRLCSTLPAREHRIKDDEPERNRMGDPVAVIVGRQRYQSIQAASRGERVSPHQIRLMLDDGRARYA